MKIETIRACDVTVGDIIDRKGHLWKVIRAPTISQLLDCREFLLLPMFNPIGTYGPQLEYMTPYADDKLTVWKTTEVT